tara:strand:+ start:294 stop:437 length:144 start_codon:yes stop_codon:yes gene_type:complete
MCNFGEHYSTRLGEKNALKSIGLEMPVLTSIHFCGTMDVMPVFLDSE